MIWKNEKIPIPSYHVLIIYSTPTKLLLSHVENSLRKYQCGFRKSKSIKDQIFATLSIRESGREYQIKHTIYLWISGLHMTVSIVSRSIRRWMIFFYLLSLCPLIKLTMSNVEYRVRLQEDISEGFTIENGVRQEVFFCFQ